MFVKIIYYLTYLVTMDIRFNRFTLEPILERLDRFDADTLVKLQLLKGDVDEILRYLSALNINLQGLLKRIIKAADETIKIKQVERHALYTPGNVPYDIKVTFAEEKILFKDEEAIRKDLERIREVLQRTLKLVETTLKQDEIAINLDKQMAGLSGSLLKAADDMGAKF